LNLVTFVFVPLQSQRDGRGGIQIDRPKAADPDPLQRLRFALLPKERYRFAKRLLGGGGGKARFCAHILRPAGQDTYKFCPPSFNRTILFHMSSRKSSGCALVSCALISDYTETFLFE
jgi:hypothetical protein